MADVDGPSRRSSGSLFCRCGAGVCLLLTSNSQKNPGRPYYRCPVANAGRCGFFKWLDEVRDHELVVGIPDCACGAGICRLDIKTAGPDAGRKCFVCPIKKGQGACNFFRWDDAPANAATGFPVDESVISPQSTSTDCNDVSSANSNLIEENGQTNLSPETESAVHTSQCPKNLVPTPGRLKRDNIKLEESKASEDSLDEPLRNCKRLRHGDSKSDGSPSGSSSICLRNPLANSRNHLTKENGHTSSPTFETEIHPRNTEFRREYFPDTTLAASNTFLFSSHHSLLPINSDGVQESWVIAAILQNLCLEIQGWWGRLAFPPSQSLQEPAAVPFFCCVFPSFDSIFVPPNVNLLSDGIPVTPVTSPVVAESCRQLLLPVAPVTSPVAAESCRQLLLVNEGAQLLGTQESSIMRESVSKAFGKAAEQLQSDLLTLLRSLDIQDDEIMVRGADTTFDALERLQIDYKIFSEQVKEYIRCASLLAKIDQSITSDHCCQMLADHFNCEKLELDEINDAYARAVDALSVSKQHAASLTKEVSHLKDKLFQTEAELSRCEAESTALNARVLEISEDKERLEQYFQITCKKVEDARKLHEQREAEENAAKAAFEKAKLLIWG